MPSRSRLDRAAAELRDDLFPLAPDGAAARIAVPAGLVAVALGTLVSLLRQRGVPATTSVWAEDASVFLDQALRAGPLDAMLRAYSGYLHLVPRLAAEVATVAPLGFAPIVFALTGAAAAAASGVAVFVATAGHLRSRWLRAALGAAVVVLPAAAYETLNSAALAQWHLAAAAMWVALWRPRRLAGAIGSAAWLAVTAASSPLAFVLAPVLLLRVVLLRSWRDRLPVLAWGTVCAAQVVAALAQPSPTPAEGGALDLARAYLARVVVPAVLGVELADRARLLVGPAAAVAATGVVLVGLAVAVGPRALHRGTGLWLTAASVVTFSAGAFSRGVAAAMAPLADGSVPTSASRFAVVPTLLLLGVLALGLDRLCQRLPAAAAVTVLVCSGLLATVVVAADLRPTTDRSPGPRWSHELVEARARCRTGAVAAELDASPVTSDFAVEVACDRLRE